MNLIYVTVEISLVQIGVLLALQINNWNKNTKDISNEIANKFQVIYESPHLIVIKNDVVVSHASQGQINDIELQ